MHSTNESFNSEIRVEPMPGSLGIRDWGGQSTRSVHFGELCAVYPRPTRSASEVRSRTARTSWHSEFSPTPPATT